VRNVGTNVPKSPRDDADSSHRGLTVFVCWNSLSSPAARSVFCVETHFETTGIFSAIFCMYIEGKSYEVYKIEAAERDDVRKN
jgi:hypothetical protein